jgi:hypothetical protein
VFLEPQGGKWISGLLGVICLLTLVYTGAAYAWGNDGHNIVAYIAADNLDPAARRSVAKLLGTPYQKEAVARAMAAASILPDNQFRARDPSTMSWHFINLCRQDHRTDIAARCDGDCVVAKINEYAARLRTENYDKWGGNGDLAFLIHFVGDINQPLHAATNDDMGANCVKIRPASDITNLHILWDVDLVTRLENQLDSGNPRKTAGALEAIYWEHRGKFVWNKHSAADVAWHSTQLARWQVYDALQIQLEPCTPKIHSCSDAPKEIVNIEQSYLDRESRVAGEQLATAGFALADLLNEIWN